MKTTRWVQRILAISLSAGMLMLALAAGFHTHDSTSLADHQHACRVCKMHDGYAAAPPASHGILPVQPAIESSAPVMLSQPRQRLVRARAPSRAPPTA